jgi:hypothetical protein
LVQLNIFLLFNVELFLDFFQLSFCLFLQGTLRLTFIFLPLLPLFL